MFITFVKIVIKTIVMLYFMKHTHFTQQRHKLCGFIIYVVVVECA